jgi:hypothetical protein
MASGNPRPVETGGFLDGVADRVRTEHVAPAVVEHPITGEAVWFQTLPERPSV